MYVRVRCCPGVTRLWFSWFIFVSIVSVWVCYLCFDSHLYVVGVMSLFESFDKLCQVVPEETANVPDVEGV